MANYILTSTNSVNKKSYSRAYILWFLLGMLGMHRIYTGNYLSAAIQGGLTVITIIATVFYLYSMEITDRTFGIIKIPAAYNYSIVYLILPIAVIIWWIIDVFLTSANVKRANETSGTERL